LAPINGLNLRQIIYTRVHIVSIRYVSYVNVLLIEMKENKKEMSLNRKKSVVLTALLVAFTAFAGCLGDDEVSCGEGTELVDGECVPIADDKESNTVTFTLIGKDMSFIGDGEDIDGIINPDLSVPLGSKVVINLVMGEANLHDITLDEFDVATEQLYEEGSMASVTFTADMEGTFAYYCSVPGHRAGGMEGKFIVGDGKNTVDPVGSIENIGPALAVDTDNIARDPMLVPEPIERTESAIVHIYMEAVELTAEIEPGTTFTYWTYNGTVPGPMFRARVGDTVVVHFSNRAESMMTHNVDFHAVTAQGGGAAATSTAPGTTSTFSFKAMHAGLFVYHCATPDVPTHISKGMYGMILIDPETPLSTVDKELYLMQGDIYTKWRPGTVGHQEFDDEALFDENPTYVVFNGKFASFTGNNTIKAEVGDTIRIYFGVGGPNTISSFHLIGEIFDNVYNLAGLENPPLESIQTVLVPPGGAVVVDVTFDVPANYILVDHALTRTFQKGAVGIIEVTGDENKEIYDEDGGQN